ncbi:MAG: TlpA family protein disulfide reductase [Kofleriaceae bacterium]
MLVAVQAIAIYRAVESGRESRGSETQRASGFTVDTIAMPDIPLTLERADGTRSTVAALRGRPVVLHFWATWCGPCRSELPTLIAQHRSLTARGVELLLVSVDDDWSDVRGFFGEGGIPPAVSRATDDTYKRLTTGTLPETLFINARGAVHARARGARDWSSPAAIDFLSTLTEAEH